MPMHVLDVVLCVFCVMLVVLYGVLRGRARRRGIVSRSGGSRKRKSCESQDGQQCLHFYPLVTRW
jgi:hypothetical protein